MFQVKAIPLGETYYGRDTIRHYAKTFQQPNCTSYVISELPSPLYGDVGVIPSLGACGAASPYFAEINLWWSSGGTISVIHRVHT